MSDPAFSSKMKARKLRNGKAVKSHGKSSGDSSSEAETESSEEEYGRKMTAREAARAALRSTPRESRRTTRVPTSRKPAHTSTDSGSTDGKKPERSSRSDTEKKKKVAKKQSESKAQSSESDSKHSDKAAQDPVEPDADSVSGPSKSTKKQKKAFLPGRRAAGLSAADLEKDKKKRLDYLLKQSEQFAHFLTSGGAEQDTSNKAKKGPAAKEIYSSQQSVDHRHARKAGSEEAREMLDTETKALPRFEKTPFYITGGEMRDYQVRGLNWLISLCENSVNGILADEMGLGKTLQTISLLGYIQHVKKSELPHLIIAPKSTLSNWQNEFKRWCPTLESVILKGDQEQRNILMVDSLKDRSWDALITSYEIALREQAYLRKHFWSYIVIDEAHRIKNESAKLSMTVRSLKSRHRLLLTGTPLQNNLHELWSLLNFLLPDVFESAADFDTWFDEQACVADMGLVERLHSILRPFLLRRVKSEVEKDLPSKTEIKLFVGLTLMQRTWYRQLLLKDITVLNASQGVANSSLQNILMHLRKVCNHPYLFEGAEPGPPYTTEKHLVDNCGKMILLHKLLPRLKAGGHRVLIFCQMTRVLDILEDYCIWTEHAYCRLDGSTAHEDREEAIRDFNAPGSKKFVFLLSTRAGGLGINLTSADTVILYDSDWNPQVDLQAMDRVHRIGQTKPVTIFRLVTENTVEERIIERAERKLRLDAMVIQSGRLVDAAKKLSKDEILKMVRYGAERIIHSDVENITDEDIDTILAKSQAKTEEMNKMFTDQTEENLKGWTNDFTEKYTVYQFEGEDFRNKNAGKIDDLDTWIALPKRERKQLYDLTGTASSSRDSPPWTPKLLKQKDKRPSIPRPPVYRFIDVHFAPRRLVHLLDQEQLVYKKAIGFKVDIDPDLPEEITERQKAEQEKIDNVDPLTAEEEAEKWNLLRSTFYNWRRSDIPVLLRALELYGPDNVEKISTSVAGKSAAEVKAYLAVFLKNFEALPDAAKIRTRILRGISNQEKQKRRREIIKAKMDASNFPEQDLKIPYPAGQHKTTGSGLTNAGNARVLWYEEEDRFLLCAYGVACAQFADDSEEMYEWIRDTIRSSDRFKFDYVMRSVTTERVKDRLETLMVWMLREANPGQPKQALTSFVTKNFGTVENVPSSTTPSSSAAVVKSRTAGVVSAESPKMIPSPVKTSFASSGAHVTPSSSTAESPVPFPKSFTLKYVDSKDGKFQMSASKDTPPTTKPMQSMIASPSGKSIAVPLAGKSTDGSPLGQGPRHISVASEPSTPPSELPGTSIGRKMHETSSRGVWGKKTFLGKNNQSSEEKIVTNATAAGTPSVPDELTKKSPAEAKIASKPGSVAGSGKSDKSSEKISASRLPSNPNVNSKSGIKRPAPVVVDDSDNDSDLEVVYSRSVAKKSRAGS